MFTSIKSKIFISHLFIVILLLGGLSYWHYANSLSNYVQSVISFSKNSSASIVSTASLAISGENYGNIQLPSFVEELASNEKLLYLNIIGKSDYSSQEFNAVYDKEHQTLYRNTYPADFQNKLEKKLKRFTASLKNPKSDKVKLNFLIERTKDAIEQYKKNMKLAKELNHMLFHKSPYIDFETNQLYLSLATSNKNGGSVSMIFDISEIVEMKNKIIKDLLFESFIALLVSIVLLNILANKIISPLNQLSEFMSKDFKSLDTSSTPALNFKDEIGNLANKFKILIQKIQEHQAQTEIIAYYDALTGVYNRQKLYEVFEEEIQRSHRYGNPLSIALIDIDKFKSFNDLYGHLTGDEILIMVAENVNTQVRESDIFARWGGEEFVILFKETSAQKALIVSKKLKDEIQKTEHPTAGHITASFGITEYIAGDTIKTILKRCDEALYRAKTNGRNRVEVA